MVAELFVIFAGVYGAFLADSYREERARDAQAAALYTALAQEVEDHVLVGQKVLDEYVARQREWKNA